MIILKIIATFILAIGIIGLFPLAGYFGWKVGLIWREGMEGIFRDETGKKYKLEGTNNDKRVYIR